MVPELGGGSGPQFVFAFRDTGNIVLVFLPRELYGKTDEVSV
jgi:hypothetical protein